MRKLDCRHEMCAISTTARPRQPGRTPTMSMARRAGMWKCADLGRVRGGVRGRVRSRVRGEG